MTNSIPFKDFTDALEVALRGDALKTVTLFCSPLSNSKTRVRVTKKCANELIITFGKPNFKEREYLKLCKKAKTNPRRTWLHFKKDK